MAARTMPLQGNFVRAGRAQTCLATISACGYNHGCRPLISGVARDRRMPRWSIGILLVIAAVLALGGYRVLTAPSTGTAPTVTASADTGSTGEQRDEFAQDRAPAPA